MRFVFFFCLLLVAGFPGAAQELGLMPRTLPTGAQDSLAVRLLISSADTVADPQRAITLCRQAISLARRYGDKKSEGLACIRAGYVYCFKISDIDSSDHYFGLAIGALRAGAVRDSLYTEAMGGLAYNQLLRGDYQGAFGKAMQGMELAQQQHDTTRMIELYSTLSNVAQGLADTQSTLSYMETAVRMARRVHYREGMADLLMGLAGVYTALGRFNEALALLEEADNLGEALVTVPHRVLGHVYRANVYLESGRYGKAMYYIQQARQLAGTIAYTGQELNMQYLLSDIYLRNKEPEKALAAAVSAITLATAQQTDHVMPQLYELKAKALEALGRDAEALAAYREYMRLEEGQVGAQAQKTVAMLNKKYQSEQQQERIQKLRSANEQVAAHWRQERQRRYVLLVIAALVLLFALAASWLYRRQRRANRLVVQQRNKLDLLIREIHHRVKNNLQTISSMISLQQRYTTDAGAGEVLTAIQSKVNAIGLIHQRLYQVDASGKVPAQAYLEQLAQSVAGLFDRGAGLLELETRITPLRIDIDTAVSLGLFLNELLTNSFKHAVAADDTLHISVVLEAEGAGYILRVTDNGRGLPAGWESRQQESLGLRIVQMMARQVSGTLTYSCQDGACFILKFVLPDTTKLYDA